MLRIAMPNKGRLFDDTRELLSDAGLSLRAAGDRALRATLGGEYEALFVRAQDVPEFVSDGAADVGITGLDQLGESGRPLVDRLDLGFGRCRLVVATREEGPVHTLADVTNGTRVATSFPRLTRQAFAALGCEVEVVPMSGAVEIAPHLGVADVVVDLTSTGSTLRMNGLREVGTLLESTARLVAPATPHKAERGESLARLENVLASVVRARGKRYLMANVPRGALAEVKRMLPGISGPTVVDILNGGEWVAVHAVVPAEGLDRLIEALQGVGGCGILVTRIERLVP
ncbi:MAG: ATP phosphoribosyltransferase [Candidatus Eisenbacteria bacterium]